MDHAPSTPTRSKRTADALRAYLRERGIDPADPWYRFPLLGLQVPLFRVRGGLRDALRAHDVHHIVTGYDTSFRGECELAGWELGSGGCGRHLMFWLDRLLLVPLALLCAPFRSFRAFRAGRRARNLYRRTADELLAADLDDVAAWTRREPLRGSP